MAAAALMLGVGNMVGHVSHTSQRITLIRKPSTFHLPTVCCGRERQLNLDLDMYACKNQNIIKNKLLLKRTPGLGGSLIHSGP